MNYKDIKKSVDKEYPGVVNSCKSMPHIKRIPTGVFAVDLLTGGGVPVNRITTFFGGKSTGKTTLSYRVASEFLKANPKKIGLFLDFEHAFDRDWATAIIGENLNRLEHVDPLHGEEGVDLLHALIKAEEVGLVIVDSLAEIFSIVEADSDAAEVKMGLTPKLQNRLLRKLLLGMTSARREGRELTTILINQTVANIGARMFQSRYTTPGSKKAEFLPSLMLQTYTKKYYKIGQETVKVAHTFTVEKNKVGVPKRSGEYLVYLAEYNGKPMGYVDEVRTIIDTAKAYGLIEKSGNKVSIAGTKFDSLTDLQRKIESDSKFRNNLKETLLEYRVVFEGEEKEEED